MLGTVNSHFTHALFVRKFVLLGGLFHLGFVFFGFLFVFFFNITEITSKIPFLNHLTG